MALEVSEKQLFSDTCAWGWKEATDSISSHIDSQDTGLRKARLAGHEVQGELLIRQNVNNLLQSLIQQGRGKED